jgi:hypothetical protein
LGAVAPLVIESKILPGGKGAPQGGDGWFTDYPETKENS